VAASSIGAKENLIKSSLSGTGTSSYEIPCSEATCRIRCAMDWNATIDAGLGLVFFTVDVARCGYGVGAEVRGWALKKHTKSRTV
jgi:hypothetical protein